ncbi:MAG: RNA 3'-terminal phosphate cyclase [Candidatus Hadarchaeaceae archaeon]
MMIEIDGSMGEGGGAVLRTALALGAVIRQPIRIFNIRARRDKPGLQAQHLCGVETLVKIARGEARGAALNSTELTFIPGEIKGGRYRVEIGTAGSTTLVLQIIMPAAAFADGPVDIEIRGGTDNPMAPPIDYFKNVTVPMLRRMGYRCEIDCLRRGHYPRGGGIVRARIEPVEQLRAISLVSQGRVLRVAGIAHAVRLPSRVANRIAHAASLELMKSVRAPVEIHCESYQIGQDPHLAPGAGLTLWAETDSGAVVGTSSLGEPGKPSEKVGREAALDLIEQLRTGMACDRYLSDQLIPYLALAEGNSEITCTSLTSHSLTNLELVYKVLGVDFRFSGEPGRPGKIKVTGFGFKRMDKS